MACERVDWSRWNVVPHCSPLRWLLDYNRDILAIVFASANGKRSKEEEYPWSNIELTVPLNVSHDLVSCFFLREDW